MHYDKSIICLHVVIRIYHCMDCAGLMNCVQHHANEIIHINAGPGVLWSSCIRAALRFVPIVCVSSGRRCTVAEVTSRSS